MAKSSTPSRLEHLALATGLRENLSMEHLDLVRQIAAATANADPMQFTASMIVHSVVSSLRLAELESAVEGIQDLLGPPAEKAGGGTPR